MAQKKPKPTAKGSKTEVRKAEPAGARNLLVREGSALLVLAVFAVAFSAMISPGLTGVAGDFLKYILRGLLGEVVWLAVPIVMLICVIAMVRPSWPLLPKRAAGASLFVLQLAAFWEVLRHSGTWMISGPAVMARTPGGLLGGYLATLASLILQSLGTSIFLIAGLLFTGAWVIEGSVGGLFLWIARGGKFLAGWVKGKAAEKIVGKSTPVGPAENELSKKKVKTSPDNLRNALPDPEPEHNTVQEEVPARSRKKEPEERPWTLQQSLPVTGEQLVLQETESQKVQGGSQTQDIHITEAAGGSEYQYPPADLLQLPSQDTRRDSNALLAERAQLLEDTLRSFGVEAKVIHVTQGPAITRFELSPSAGVKVSKIVGLSDDIALNLATSGIRIEAPIPGKSAIGIEVPNKEMSPVLLREVIGSKEFSQSVSRLSFAIGKDIAGDLVVGDIAKMPHVLIAGATGSGKSVCINSLILSLLYKATPDEVRLIMIDPKMVELSVYNGIPHLLIPVVTDPKKAAGALQWAVNEMVNRYRLFAEKGVRDLRGYNILMDEQCGGEGRMPQIVVIIDELADLMMVAPGDVEDAIMRLAQMARAAGMHLVIATQRPSVDVITGVIKANIPSRVAFAVSSQVDSRTILDMVGAEKLLGRGDMLYFPIGEPKPLRVKGTFVTDAEVERVVRFLKERATPEYNETVMQSIESAQDDSPGEEGAADPLLSQAIEVVVDAGQASASLLQRKFKVGYARAARIIDQMESRGIVGRFEGSKPRQVYMSKQELQELKMTE